MDVRGNRKKYLSDVLGKNCLVCKHTYKIHEFCSKEHWVKVLKKKIVSFEVDRFFETNTKYYCQLCFITDLNICHCGRSHNGHEKGEYVVVCQKGHWSWYLSTCLNLKPKEKKTHYCAKHKPVIEDKTTDGKDGQPPTNITPVTDPNISSTGKTPTEEDVEQPKTTDIPPVSDPKFLSPTPEYESDSSSTHYSDESDQSPLPVENKKQHHKTNIIKSIMKQTS